MLEVYILIFVAFMLKSLTPSAPIIGGKPICSACSGKTEDFKINSSSGSLARRATSIFLKNTSPNLARKIAS